MKSSPKSYRLSDKQKEAVLNEVAFMAATGNLYQSPQPEPPPEPVLEPEIWTE